MIGTVRVRGGVVNNKILQVTRNGLCMLKSTEDQHTDSLPIKQGL